MDLEKLALFELIKSTFLNLDEQEKLMLFKHDLSLARFYVLLHVHNHPRINQVELTNLMLCTKGNITRIVQGMEAEGLIERASDPKDGRRTLLKLTANGKALLYTVFKDYEYLVEDLMGRFTSADLKKYTQDLRAVQNTLIQNADQDPESEAAPVLVLKDQGEIN